MEEINNKGTYESYGEEEELGSKYFNFQFFFATLILNWKWFVLILIISLGLASIYLRYTTPSYKVTASLLIKDDEQMTRRPSSQILGNISELGFMNNSSGFDNEVEILKSHTLAADAVKDLKLYTTYSLQGRVKARLLYKDQPVNVDIDALHRDKLDQPIKIDITKNGNKFDINIKFSLNSKYTVVSKDKQDKIYETKKTSLILPAVINTKVGRLTFTTNGLYTTAMEDGKTEKVVLSNPQEVGKSYANRTGVSETSKTTTIAELTLTDAIPERASDYLKQLVVVYNRQANEDKNEIAFRTEKFINTRLQKISVELGNTDGAISTYKRNNSVVDVTASAAQSMTQSAQYDTKLTDAQTQLMLLNSISDYMNQPSNKFQPIPSNVGLTDASSTSLINEYNATVLERNRLLRTASDKSPNVQALTSQLEDLIASIKTAIFQAKNNQTMVVNSIGQQYNKYNGQISQTPEQERVLTKIGREQEVKSSLYIMLLQKREENSISLASTANKGKLIDDPEDGGRVSPNSGMIMGAAWIIGLLFPFAFFIAIAMLRYRIEGREDVMRLTKCPIIADVAVANETAKEKADIVVHENKNNQMEEIFRSMRTNLQFTMKENEKVVMFTSSTSGEGKTFCAANLAVSFALLGKKVLLVGLDIRRPRLNQLFEINDKIHGITNLLVKNNITEQDVDSQIVPSSVNVHLDVMMAGPIPPNPAELVSRKSLDEVFAILRKKYDFIIVDTAPVGLVTDTLNIGRIADATAFTVRADYTEKGAFGMLNQWVEEKKLPNVNIIINGIDMSKKKYGYAYGYGKYGKYGKYGYGYSSKYGTYGYSSYSYGYGYGNYTNSHYGNANDDSIKK